MGPSTGSRGAPRRRWYRRESWGVNRSATARAPPVVHRRESWARQLLGLVPAFYRGTPPGIVGRQPGAAARKRAGGTPPGIVGRVNNSRGVAENQPVVPPGIVGRQYLLMNRVNRWYAGIVGRVQQLRRCCQSWYTASRGARQRCRRTLNFSGRGTPPGIVGRQRHREPRHPTMWYTAGNRGASAFPTLPFQ